MIIVNLAFLFRLQVKEIRIKVIVYNLSRMISTLSFLVLVEEFYRAEKMRLNKIQRRYNDHISHDEWYEQEQPDFRVPPIHIRPLHRDERHHRVCC